MNKYIESDIHNGTVYLKCAVMNVLHAIENNKIKEFIFETISLAFLIKCAEAKNWKEDPNMDWDWTNGYQIDYWYKMVTPDNKHLMISGSLLESTKIHIRVYDNE